MVVSLGLVLVVVAVVALAVVQLLRAVPRPALVPALATSVVVPGPPPALPWPTIGEAAVSVAGIGSFAPAGGSAPIPIGSVAKVMAAYVVLKDHPLTSAGDGPGITVTPADVAMYTADKAAQDSVLAVTAGEVLTERQALEGLLVPSGDNIAVLLADWDAGSVPAFVAKMNAAAAALSMARTHYVDVSGLDPNTVSTATDQMVLAPLTMADPVFASIVAMPQVTLPVAGTVYNYNTLLGTDGIIGIKTGSTPQAGGNLMFAAQADLAGHPETIYGVVLGQQGKSIITAALGVSQTLLDAVKLAVHPVIVVPAGTVVVRVSDPWATATPVVSATPVELLGWSGLRARLAVTPYGGLARSTPAGAAVGQLSVAVGSQHAGAILHTVRSAPGPSLAWRLSRT